MTELQIDDQLQIDDIPKIDGGKREDKRKNVEVPKRYSTIISAGAGSPKALILQVVSQLVTTFN